MEQESRDLLRDRSAASVVFGLPILALVVSGAASVNFALRTAIWVAALSAMGVACVVNARRCGRVHCYATGPFFLIMAGVTLLYGLGLVPLGARGWSWISLAVLVGAVVLCCVPEALFGRYYRPGSR